MSEEETFPIALGGHEWSLPHLSFRTIKAMQPTLFEIYAEIGAQASDAQSASLSEAHLDRLAQVTWRALATVDPDLAYDAFLDLPFSVSDLIKAFPSLAYAAGLRPANTDDFDAAAEGPRSQGKSISTAW